METIDFYLYLSMRIQLHMYPLIVIDALEKIDSKLFFASILGGSVPHPAP